MKTQESLRVLGVICFAAAFAWVEASVVVYLRDIYYPQGFGFPLKPMDESRIGIEVIREASTLVMLGIVGTLAGRSRWQKFAFFAIAFGVWDILFYLWLKAMIGWPSSIFEWDILFLLPLPWIGPVLAPVLVSLVLIVGGSIVLRVERERNFRPSASAWILATAGSGLILWTFMRDTDAGFHGSMPQEYQYWVLAVGLIMCSAAIGASWRAHRRTSEPDRQEN